MFLHTLWLSASLKQPAHTCRKKRVLPLSSPWHIQTHPARLVRSIVRILQCLIQHVSAGPWDRYCCCRSLPVSSYSSSCATSSSSSWLLASALLSFAARRQQAATRLVNPGSGSSVSPACLAAAQESEMSIGSFQRHHSGSSRAGGAGETAGMKRSWNYHGYSIPTIAGELKQSFNISLMIKKFFDLFLISLFCNSVQHSKSASNTKKTQNWSFDAQACVFRCVHKIRLLVSLVLLNWLF